MIFVHSGSEYSAILRNGDVIKFEDEREALAVQAEFDKVQEVLGKRLPARECRMRYAEIGERKNACEKKKVRINVDTDTEHFCYMNSENKKALA